MTVPDAMIRRLERERAEREAHHLAFQNHEFWVITGYLAELEKHPELSCSEWALRHPFKFEPQS